MRRLVSGVRSSWLASVTSCCCWRFDTASASTIVEKLVGQAPDLAAAGLGDRRFEILGAGDALRGVAEPLDRAHEPTGERPAEQRGGGDADQAQREQLQPQRREDVLGLVERAGRLQRAAVGPRRR